MANCSMVQNEALKYVISKRLHVNTRYLEYRRGKIDAMLKK